jgi:hypothetical protein
MKTESQIRHKLKQVIFRHKKKFLEARMKCSPENCASNKLVKLRTPHGHQNFRVCAFKNDSVDQTDMICDPNMGGMKQAESCPYFTLRYEAEILKDMFASRLGLDGTEVEFSFLAKEYPDVIALLWVLGDSTPDKQGVFSLSRVFQNIDLENEDDGT